eukprot:scaffold876_cov68-Phaeocystis_antarctica.AAC.7
MFGGDFGLPPGPRYERRSTGGAPPVVYLCHAVAPRRSSCRIVELVQRLRLPPPIAPNCDTVSTYHITDNARGPQRGLSRATYLLKVSRRAAEPNEEES